MAEIVIVDSSSDNGESDWPFSMKARPIQLAKPIPAHLDEEQIAFWLWFPSSITPLGELRRKIGLTRREWYHPTDNPRYHQLAHISDHLMKEPERVKQLLEDESAFLAYVAALRLHGA